MEDTGNESRNGIENDFLNRPHYTSVSSRGKLERSCCPELASTIVLQVVENIESK